MKRLPLKKYNGILRIVNPICEIIDEMYPTIIWNENQKYYNMGRKYA